MVHNRHILHYSGANARWRSLFVHLVHQKLTRSLFLSDITDIFPSQTRRQRLADAAPGARMACIAGMKYARNMWLNKRKHITHP
jgi:hypothetical protein